MQRPPAYEVQLDEHHTLCIFCVLPSLHHKRVAMVHCSDGGWLPTKAILSARCRDKIAATGHEIYALTRAPRDGMVGVNRIQGFPFRGDASSYQARRNPDEDLLRELKADIGELCGPVAKRDGLATVVGLVLATCNLPHIKQLRIAKYRADLIEHYLNEITKCRDSTVACGGAGITSCPGWKHYSNKDKITLTTIARKAAQLKLPASAERLFPQMVLRTLCDETVAHGWGPFPGACDACMVILDEAGIVWQQ